MNKKLRAQGGFTLAELLIIVAIIGVLVAISIPILWPRLEGSRESTDVANLRSAYAAATAAVLAGKVDDGTSEGTPLANGPNNLIYTKDGTLTLDDKATPMAGKSTQGGWQGTNLSADLPSSIHFEGNSQRKGIRVTVDTDDNTVNVGFGDDWTGLSTKS